MIKGKKGPLILLLVLIILVCFIAGMQYGKTVERADKTIRYVLSITPSPEATPSSSQSITYLTYTNEECGIEFVYPSILNVSPEASSEATFTDSNSSQFISVSCNEEVIPTPQGASTEAQLGNRDGISYETADTIKFRVRNTQGELISAEVSKELVPLFTSSFSFIP